MKELLSKLSSYNILNNLLPGIIFSIITSKTTELNLLQPDILTGVFIYYFIGLIISRIGSLIIEPILIKTKFIKLANYKDFINVSKQDEKVEILSETNNMYRTFISMLFLLLLVKFYCFLVSKYTILIDYSLWILILSLFLLFLFSYRKQTKYIKSRIDSQKDSL